MTPQFAENHLARLAHLLDLEADAEQRRAIERIQRLSSADAEATGQSLAALVVRDEYSGLGGRCVVTLSKRHSGSPLPWTRLQVGSPIVLTPEEGGDGQRGVVSEKDAHYLRVALDEPTPEDAGPFRLDLSADVTAVQRQRSALHQARALRGDLRDVLLGDLAPRFDPPPELAPLDSGLNAEQIEAVRFCLSARTAAVIHGPPGTGKTTTVVELIRQAVRRGDRVLVCAPSNLAVDNVLEKLLAAGEDALRLGHPARVLPGLREHTLDLVVEDHPDTRLARKLAKDAFALFRQASKWKRGKPDPNFRRDLRQEARSMLGDARQMETAAVEQVLTRARIVCATMTGLDPQLLGKRTFDLAVLDEACQSTEPGAWLPILRAGRVVLAGDHCQLPPTVLAVEAQRQGFGVSLLERLVDQWGERITRRLEVQYRMNEAIAAFSSDEFYDGSLRADDSVKTHRLDELAGVSEEPLTTMPLEFIDTAGAGYDEETEPDGESRFNEQEAQLVRRKVEALLAGGVRPEQIGVIAPYSAQVRRLRELLPHDGLEIDSVDGFQGREKEAIVVSLVRSNSEGDIGFLGDVRRTNVALTRARRKLLLIGDSATLACHPFYQRLVEHLERTGAYRTVWEE